MQNNSNYYGYKKTFIELVVLKSDQKFKNYWQNSTILQNNILWPIVEIDSSNYGYKTELFILQLH